MFCDDNVTYSMWRILTETSVSARNSLKNMNRKQLIKLGAQGALTLGLAISLSSCGGGDDLNAISVNGSDTMLQVGLAWAEKYQQLNDDIGLTVNGEGSGTGIKALINGTIQIAHSSRPMKDTEREQIKAAHGKEAVQHIVGYDGIAVFVHPSNPVKSLSLEQLHGIWAEGGTINNWSQVGGPDLEINRAGRNNASGTYSFFQSAVCGKGSDGKGIEFKQGTAAMPGSTAVVEFCETTPSAIGYSGMGYKTEKVGWLQVSKTTGAAGVGPSNPTVASGDYPIARALYIYTVGEPEGDVKEYLDWIKGPEGQAIVEAESFVPLSN